MNDYAMEALTEKQFQQMIVTRATYMGWWSNHNPDSRRSTAGLPDLILVHPRAGVLFREIKTVKGRLRDDQANVIAMLQAAGADVDVWRPTDWDSIETIIDNPARYGKLRRSRTPSIELLLGS